MNHIFLPGQGRLDLGATAAARYGVNLMELLINKIMSLGGNRSRLLAKVFGGGHVISTFSPEMAVGGKNAAFALEFLRKENIRVVARDIEGPDSRKVLFHTDSGAVFLKRIRSDLFNKVAAKELAFYRQAMQQSQQAGEVTLFHENLPEEMESVPRNQSERKERSNDILEGAP